MKSSINKPTVDHKKTRTKSITHMVTVSCNKGVIEFDKDTINVNPGDTVQFDNNLEVMLTLKFPDNTGYTKTTDLEIPSDSSMKLNIKKKATSNSSHSYNYLPTNCKANTPLGHQNPDLDHPVIFVD